MGELALFTLLAIALPPEDADDRPRIDAEGDLLYLAGPGEQKLGFSFGVLGGFLLPDACILFCLLPLLFGAAA